MKELHTDWLKLGRKYSDDEQYIESVWKEVKRKYTGKKRHYHNLNHIYHMLRQAKECEAEVDDAEVVSFAIWFHDIIYKSSKKDNEEKSAEFARRTLENTELEKERVDKVYDLILSTKKHEIINPSIDNDFLLDFDLSILGQPWNVYEEYIQNIRKEYSIYPSFLYNPGRKKVLESFLRREVLYFTEKYRVLYEDQARKNLEKEIKMLS
ncbi:HD domain-containing protein [Pseudotenacibaculum haliotis]|uniref:Metal-dependent HD superfamily phosphohydrolase n=1 Tax=Pseudotenacibaculum haliotis TaxID=1862138 RepID=A0ABW5LQ47_9FLAO